MHQYLQNALESLSKACNRSGLHPVDEASIKRHLRVLKQHDIPLDVKEIEIWLRAHGWQDKPTLAVVRWARTLSEGGRVQIKHASHLVSEADIWVKIQGQTD